MARQIAAGYRSAGTLFGGFAGGSADGLDLVPSVQRVLHAHQILTGVRQAGPLVITAPWGELPSIGSYPAPYQGMPGFADATPSQWNNDNQAGGQCRSLLGSQKQPNQSNGRGGGGGDGGAGSNYSSGQSAPPGHSDEFCVPYSVRLLGSFSPYRGLKFPQELTCFKCGAQRQHYAHECPARFVRVRGEPPPGWRLRHHQGPIGVARRRPD